VRLFAALATLLLWGCTEGRAARVDPARYDAFYLWAGVKPQPVLAEAKTLYILAGEVRRDGAWEPLRAAAPKLAKPEVWLVVRAASLDWSEGTRVAVWRELRLWQKDARIVGLQVDFDSATSGIGEYAAFLSSVRQDLPREFQLSVTGLLDWSANADPAALAQLKGVVDEVVVQSYQHRSTIPGYARYLERLARVPVPHKVALVQGGEWLEPAALRNDPLFRGYVVFLLNP
jgi:hypothetical protein